MANGSDPSIGGMSSSPVSMDLFSRLMAIKQALPKETLEALEFRSKRGYKPVNVEDKYIDVESQDEFNRYKKALSSMPLDPAVRNKFISQLGYRPVLRLKSKETVSQPTEQRKLVPRKDYELSFTTMPGKTMKLGSESEYQEAKTISDIDNALADVYRKKFPSAGLNRDDAYKTYTTVDPQQYSKMYLSEADRNAAIADYAKQKGVDPQSLIGLYTQKRSQYYPRELVSGKGALEQQGQDAASTVYGFRNYLTTMIPKVTESTEEVIQPGNVTTEKESESTYPFRFGYKADSGSRPKPTKPSSPGTFEGDCPGGICEKLGERMAERNKYLFKRKDGGRLQKSGYVKLYSVKDSLF